MKEKVQKGAYVGILLLTVILLFTIVDYWIHGLEDLWSVPDYYFRNKIPFGFLWAVVGCFIAFKFRSIWVRALWVSGLTAIVLQARYFFEGYPLDFVLVFLLFHFLILYVLSLAMFKIIK